MSEEKKAAEQETTPVEVTAKTEATADVKEETPKQEVKEEPVIAPAEFDWDAYSKGISEYSESDFNDYKTKYESALNTVSPNEVLDGVVVTLTDREVIVNVNYKSDGIISRNEFRYNDDLKAGVNNIKYN